MSLNDQAKVITERTLIPIGIAVAVIGGAAWWLANLDGRVANASAAIVEIRQEQRQYSENHQAIREALAKIQGQLERLRR